MAGKARRDLRAGKRRPQLNGRRSILPMHGSRHELKRGTVDAIKRQLGLK